MATQRPEIFPSTTREIICIITLCFSVSTASLGSGALQLALPKISEYFGISGGGLTWIIASAFLTAGSFLLLCGSLSDIIGRKKMLLFSYAWFSIWNLAAGFAKSDILFDIFRGLSGIGTAGSIPACVGILSSTYLPGTRKNKAFAVLGGFQPLGYAFGIVTGGIATEFLSWQANVWFLAIWYAIITVSAWFFVPSDKKLLEYIRKLENRGNRLSVVPSRSMVSDASLFQLLKQVDFVGAGLITTGFALFIYALTAAGKAKSGWGSADVLSCLIIGFGLIGVFLVWQWQLGRKQNATIKPLMPLSIWIYPNIALIMLIVSLAWINFAGVLQFWTTLWFQNINKTSPLITTARFLPQVIGGFLVNLFAAYTLHIVSGKILLIVGMLAFTGSTLLFALQSADTLYWAMSFPALCLSVIGADLVYIVANLYITESVPNNLKSTAGAVFNTVICLATTIGLGAGAAVANSVESKGIYPGESQVNFLVRIYHSGYWFGTGSAALGTLLCFFVKVGRQGHTKQSDIEDNDQAIDDNTPGDINSHKVAGVNKEIEDVNSVPSPELPGLDADDKSVTNEEKRAAGRS